MNKGLKCANIVAALLSLLLSPGALEPGTHEFYTPKYPVVIMDSGKYQYVLEAPGGKITRKEVTK